jgi:hypothetical protein
MKYNVFDLTLGLGIIDNNQRVYISSGVVTPSIMNFKFRKEKSYKNLWT